MNQARKFKYDGKKTEIDYKDISRRINFENNNMDYYYITQNTLLPNEATELKLKIVKEITNNIQDEFELGNNCKNIENAIFHSLELENEEQMENCSVGRIFSNNNEEMYSVKVSNVLHYIKNISLLNLILNLSRIAISIKNKTKDVTDVSIGSIDISELITIIISFILEALRYDLNEYEKTIMRTLLKQDYPFNSMKESVLICNILKENINFSEENIKRNLKNMVNLKIIKELKPEDAEDTEYILNESISIKKNNT